MPRECHLPLDNYHVGGYRTFGPHDYLFAHTYQKKNFYHNHLNIRRGRTVYMHSTLWVVSNRHMKLSGSRLSFSWFALYNVLGSKMGRCSSDGRPLEENDGRLLLSLMRSFTRSQSSEECCIHHVVCQLGVHDRCNYQFQVWKFKHMLSLLSFVKQYVAPVSTSAHMSECIWRNTW